MGAVENDNHITQVQITFLAQASRPMRGAPPRPPAVTALMRAETPPLHFYRYLFDRVGAPHHWVSRRYMDDEELSRIIHDTDDYIYVLYERGTPCGFAEIDGRGRNTTGAAEIKFFGLMPEAQGRGYGKWFFHQTVELAWALSPKKVLIETCTADHPAALPLYQKFGFTPYDVGHGVIEWQG